MSRLFWALALAAFATLSGCESCARASLRELLDLIDGGAA